MADICVDCKASLDSGHHHGIGECDDKDCSLSDSRKPEAQPGNLLECSDLLYFTQGDKKMQTVNDVYKISIKDIRRKAKMRLTENERAYTSLKNKDSAYARGIKQLQDLHRKVYETYRDAPDEI